MRTVTVKAINVKPGDVIRGQRVKAKHPYVRRIRSNIVLDKADMQGVVLVMPKRDGYGLDVVYHRGGEKIVVKRPKYNMTRKGTK